MSEYVTLLGTEAVANAARRIEVAAQEMSRAASSADESLRLLSLRVEDWLERFERCAEKLGGDHE